jgi:hypothetical protein
MRTITFMMLMIGCGGSDTTPRECSGLASVCEKSGDCCSGLCTPTTLGAVCTCLNPHQPCTNDDQCCTHSCNAGSCSCAATGASCNGDSDCCSNHCDDGVCSAPPDLAQPPDMAKLPPCDPLAQTNCPSGEACYVLSDSVSCQSPGVTATARTCSSTFDCAPGNVCLDNPDSVCRRLCSADYDCRTTPGNQLPVSSSNVAYCNFTYSSTSYVTCSIPCNPVAAIGGTGCGAGKCSVYSLAAGQAEYSDCGTAGTGAEGDTCAGDYTCAAGLNCFSSNGGPSHCRRMCRTGNNGDCSAVAGTTCQTITGWTQFGACCPSTGC